MWLLKLHIAKFKGSHYMISLNEQNHLDTEKGEESDIWGIINYTGHKTWKRSFEKKKKTVNLYYLTATWSSET